MARKQQPAKHREHVHFASITEMVADINQPWQKSMNETLARSYVQSSDVRASWYGAPCNAQQVVRMASVEGNANGERVMLAFHEQIAQQLPRALGIARMKRRGEMGDELDIHTTLRGAHDKAWTTSFRAIKRGSGILRLCVDIGGNCSQDADDLQWRGMAGAALAEVMRRAGYSVEIVACFSVTNPSKTRGADGRDVIVSCVVKPRTALPDFGSLAATVGLSGFFRTLGFAAIVRGCDNARQLADSSLGHYLDVSGVLPADPKVTTLFVPSNVMNEASAVEWVKQTVQLLQGARS